MMGWTWEEIDSILEDSGFSAQAIATAIKNAQKYAYECLKDGPFKNLEAGQLVKLKSGYVGKLINKSAEHVSVLQNKDKVEVTSDKIDFDISANILRKAHVLREGAKKIMREAQADTYMTESGEELQIPGAPTKGPMISPDPEDKWEKPYLKERTPPGWAEQVPETGNVEEVTKLAHAALEDLDALMLEKQQWEEEKKELVAKSKEIQEVINQMEKQESEIAKNIFAIISAEDKALDDLDVKVFAKYKEKLLGLERKLKAEEVAPTFEQELDAVYQFLQLNHPEIVQNIKDAIEFWMQQHTFIKEQILSKLHYFKAPKKKRSQGWSKIKTWLSDAWNKTKQFFNSLMNETLPMVDEGIALMDALENSVGTAVTAKKVEKALKIYFK
jgi:hypothetical protein